MRFWSCNFRRVLEGGWQSISNCSISMRSATWALLRQLRMHVCCRAPTLETCCNAKWKRKEIWSRKTWGLTLASKKWQLSSIAWRLHCTSTTRCKIHCASRADEVSQPRSAGILVWVTSNMDSALVVSKPWQLFARNKTIPWQNSAALPWQMMARTLRPCCWVLTEQVQNVVCRKQMQLGSAMSLQIVRTSCLICFVKCPNGQPGFQRDKLSTLSCQCGPKSCQKPRRPSVAQRKKAAVELGLRESPWQVTTNYTMFTLAVAIWYNASTLGINALNIVNILWSTPFWRVEESTWVTLNLADVQKRRDKFKVGPTHESLDDIWEEMGWDKMRRAQMRWSVEYEECSVKCGAWKVQCEVWSVKKAMRSEKWEVWTVKCEVWTVDCEVSSVKCEVRRVQCEECSVECEVELQMWHVKQDTTFAECTHARAWRAHCACKFYRWERSYIYIYIFKATSAPPRAGTTGNG